MVRQFLSLRGPCPSLYCARNHGKAGFVTATMSDSPSSRDSSPRDRRQGGLRVLGGSLGRSEEHTSELQSLMRSSYAVFCLKKKKTPITIIETITSHKPTHKEKAQDTTTII